MHKNPSSQFSIAAVASALALSACGSSSPKPVPAEEPSESDIVSILESQYARIVGAGGLPVTVTASGHTTVLKPKIWEAHKDEPCRLLPGSKPGEYECSLNLMVTLREGDKEPGKHAERVHVSWDEVEGEWVGAEVLRERRKQRK